MESLFRFVAKPSPCGYLPDQRWRLEYEIVRDLSADEYMQRMREGWRRFGHTLFRPRCSACSACQSIRVLVNRFRPDRSMRRVHNANAGVVRVEIGEPSVTPAKLDLYDRFHAFQSSAKDWPIHDVNDAYSYTHSFVDNPLPVEEWCYFLADRLVGVGYVDVLPAGLSAIYFFYDPDERQRSLGTWNILSLIHETASRKLPHLYLGYYVADCQSMVYKARFTPNQVRGPDGRWKDFRG